MELIGPEVLVLSVLELKNLRSRTSSIMGQIEPDHPKLLALEFGKIAESDLVCTLSSTNIHQSAPNLVKMYVTLRSRMSLIMDLIRLELS